MLSSKDYTDIARIHLTSIDQGFLPTLGERFLALLYRAMDEIDVAVLVVERAGPDVIGFVSGGCSMKAIYKQMLFHLPTLICTLGPAMINPKKLRGIMEILLQSHSSTAVNRPDWELFSIALLPHARGSGIAKKMYLSFSEALQDKGVENFAIVVGEKLAPAHQFYRKMGATPIDKISIHGSANSIIYINKMNN